MRTNTQEAVLSAYIASIGKRTPRDAASDAAELCRFALRSFRPPLHSLISGNCVWAHGHR
jgi:hypothetical protein